MRSSVMWQVAGVLILWTIRDALQVPLQATAFHSRCVLMLPYAASRIPSAINHTACESSEIHSPRAQPPHQSCVQTQGAQIKQDCVALGKQVKPPVAWITGCLLSFSTTLCTDLLFLCRFLLPFCCSARIPCSHEQGHFESSGGNEAGMLHRHAAFWPGLSGEPGVPRPARLEAMPAHSLASSPPISLRSSSFCACKASPLLSPCTGVLRACSSSGSPLAREERKRKRRGCSRRSHREREPRIHKAANCAAPGRLLIACLLVHLLTETWPKPLPCVLYPADCCRQARRG